MGEARVDSLPRSLTLLGAGGMASELATILSALGVEVVMIDRDAQPTPEFLRIFEDQGGRYLTGRGIVAVDEDGPEGVVTRLDDGTEITTEKALWLGAAPVPDRLMQARADRSPDPAARA